jgi:hypothetical protein
MNRSPTHLRQPNMFLSKAANSTIVGPTVSRLIGTTHLPHAYTKQMDIMTTLQPFACTVATTQSPLAAHVASLLPHVTDAAGSLPVAS